MRFTVMVHQRTPVMGIHSARTQRDRKMIDQFLSAWTSGSINSRRQAFRLLMGRYGVEALKALGYTDVDMGIA
jgi:hypothetical protein